MVRERRQRAQAHHQRRAERQRQHQQRERQQRQQRRQQQQRQEHGAQPEAGRWQDPFPPELCGINALTKRRGHFLVDAGCDLAGFSDTWRRSQHQAIEDQDARMAAMGMDEVARGFVHAKANMTYLEELRRGFGDEVANALLLHYLALGAPDESEVIA